VTVVSPEEPDSPELLLEPNDNAAASTFQKAIYAQGMPLAGFAVQDTQSEYERLKALGVKFTMERTQTWPMVVAVFDDTCGNLIQVFQA
jgi:hypothetical protein